MSLDELRVPDGTECGDTTTSHPIDDLLRQLLVGDDAHCFRVEFLDEAVRELHHVGLAVFSGVCAFR